MVCCLGRRKEEHDRQPALKADVESSPRMQMEQDTRGGPFMGPESFVVKYVQPNSV